MEIYKSEVQEISSRVIEIEEKSLYDAISTVSGQYSKAQIILNDDDPIKVNFVNINAQDANEGKNSLIKEVINYLYKDEKKHFEELGNRPKNHIFRKLKRLKKLSELTDF